MAQDNGPEPPYRSAFADQTPEEAAEFRKQFGLGEYHPDNEWGDDQPELNGHAFATAVDSRGALITQAPAVWIGPPQPIDWMVEGCFARRTVGMLSGDGGLGKSLLGQQLLTCAALGKPWLGMNVKPAKCLGIFCEDDYDELQRRQEPINRLYGCTPDDLKGRLEYASLAGLDAIMAEFDQKTNEANVLPLFGQIRQAMLDMQAQILFLDTLADVFGGSEINRSQARRFIHMLRRLSMEMHQGGLVLLAAHPSLAGLSSGSGLSGSTAWNNSVRARMYLTKPEDGEDSERILKTMKNNQGALGNEIRLRWEGGVFIAHTPGGLMDAVDKADLDGRLAERLKDLVQAGTKVAADSNNSKAFCNSIRKETGFKRYSQSDILAAQLRLINSGRIVTVEIGPKSRRYSYLRTPDQRYPGEPPAPPE